MGAQPSSIILQALSGKQTLFSLQEMLSEAASKGAEGTPLADTLRRRTEVAKRWEQRGAQFLADAEEAKQSLEALEVSSACRIHFIAFYAASVCHSAASSALHRLGVAVIVLEGMIRGLQSHSGLYMAASSV